MRIGRLLVAATVAALLLGAATASASVHQERSGRRSRFRAPTVRLRRQPTSTATIARPISPWSTALPARSLFCVPAWPPDGFTQEARPRSQQAPARTPISTRLQLRRAARRYGTNSRQPTPRRSYGNPTVGFRPTPDTQIRAFASDRGDFPGRSATGPVRWKHATAATSIYIANAGVRLSAIRSRRGRRHGPQDRASSPPTSTATAGSTSASGGQGTRLHRPILLRTQATPASLPSAPTSRSDRCSSADVARRLQRRWPSSTSRRRATARTIDAGAAGSAERRRSQPAPGSPDGVGSAIRGGPRVSFNLDGAVDLAVAKQRTA